MLPNLEAFKTAASGIYSDPMRVAQSNRRDHEQYLEQAKAKIQAVTTPENQNQADTMLETFERQYGQRVASLLSTQSGIYSWFVSGASNYPKRRMEKRMNVENKKLTELLEWRDYRVSRICRVLRKMVASSRIDQLKADLEKREKQQHIMKETNKILRKYKYVVSPAMIQALEPFGVKETHAQKLCEPDFAGRKGFADYEMVNNGASIRRLKMLVEEEEKRLAKSQIQPVTEKEVNGVKVVEDVADNRLRLCFDGKPAPEIISKLKSRGWRWSPSNMAWQRQLTNDARYSAQEILKAL